MYLFKVTHLHKLQVYNEFVINSGLYLPVSYSVWNRSDILVGKTDECSSHAQQSRWGYTHKKIQQNDAAMYAVLHWLSTCFDLLFPIEGDALSEINLPKYLWRNTLPHNFIVFPPHNEVSALLTENNIPFLLCTILKGYELRQLENWAHLLHLTKNLHTSRCITMPFHVENCLFFKYSSCIWKPLKKLGYSAIVGRPVKTSRRTLESWPWEQIVRVSSSWGLEGTIESSVEDRKNGYSFSWGPTN